MQRTMSGKQVGREEQCWARSQGWAWRILGAEKDVGCGGGRAERISGTEVVDGRHASKASGFNGKIEA